MSDTITTILAMLAGFITAFLAEPVKIFFQKRIKLMDIRRGIYQEMWMNYTLICSLEGYFPHYSIDVENERTSLIKTSALALKTQLRTQFYDYVLRNELSLLYQLSEVTSILSVYASLSYLQEGLLRRSFDESDTQIKILVMSCDDYKKVFTKGFYLGYFDDKLIKKIVQDEIYYFEIVAMGKDYYEKSKE